MRGARAKGGSAGAAPPDLLLIRPAIFSPALKHSSPRISTKTTTSPSDLPQVLHLQCNFLGREGGAALAATLRGNQALLHLNLMGNTLEDIAPLASALPATRIEELHLGLNRLGDAGCAALCAALRATRLRRLNLSQNELGPPSLGPLAAALRGNTRLEGLDLSQNRLCGRDAADALRDHVACGLTGLCDALRGSAVSALCLAGNQLGPHAAALLAKGLAHNAVLTNLRLESNGVSDYGAYELAAVRKAAPLPTSAAPTPVPHPDLYP